MRTKIILCFLRKASIHLSGSCLRSKTTNITLFVWVICLTGTGCSTLLRTSNSVQFMSYNELDAAVRKYEKTGVDPRELRANIAEVYACRSVCTAQQDLYFKSTRGSMNMVREGAKGIPVIFIAGVLATPIGFCLDTLYLPVQWIRTATFSEKKVDAALRDLQRARELGYTDTTWHPLSGMFTPRRRHLDELGFRYKGTKTEPEN